MYHRCLGYAIYLSIFVLRDIVFGDCSCNQFVIWLDVLPFRPSLFWPFPSWIGLGLLFLIIWQIPMLERVSIYHELALIVCV